MSVGLYSHTTRGTGTILTALIYNGDHVNHITNQNIDMTGAWDSVGEMQSESDPGGPGSEMVAPSLAVWMQQVQFVLHILGGGSYWGDVPGVPVGPGDVVGPGGGVVDEEFALFDGTTGKIIQGGKLKATVAQVRAATAAKVLEADLLETAASSVTLTDAATIAVDWDAFINGNVTLTANRVLGAPSNAQPGTSRTIRVIGNSGTPRTLTYDASYRGGSATLSDVSNAKEYLITLFALSSTICILKTTQALP